MHSRSLPVLNKVDMYRRLSAGEFGNTNPSWDGVTEWTRRRQFKDYPLWGVRSKVAGDPKTKLNTPVYEVERYCVDNGLFLANISPMVKAWSVLWEGDICQRWDGAGLLCSGNAGVEPGSWRTHMKKPRLWEGSAATRLLRHVLNENSYDDLMILLDKYPDHVVELSALNHCFGTVPGRNAVVWEVRRY